MQDPTVKFDNYLGAFLFWLYILAALSLTGLIVNDLWRLQAGLKSGDHNQDDKDVARKKQGKAEVFVGLSVLSFAVLSFHMLLFLIDHYKAWAIANKVELPPNLMGIFRSQIALNIWEWSHTSTLFTDFAHELCEDPRHYWWTSQALIYSFTWNILMTVQGMRHNIPHLWSYFLLSQILPGSFTQNLFCTAILSSRPPTTDNSTRWPSPMQQALIVAMFYIALLLAPKTVHTPYEMAMLLATRALMVALYPLPSIASGKGQTSSKDVHNSLRYSANLILIGSITFIPLQTWRAGSVVSAIQSLNESWAVSALGYSYLIGVGSLGLFVRESWDSLI